MLGDSGGGLWPTREDSVVGVKALVLRGGCCAVAYTRRYITHMVVGGDGNEEKSGGDGEIYGDWGEEKSRTYISVVGQRCWCPAALADAAVSDSVVPGLAGESAQGTGGRTGGRWRT